MSLGSAPKRTAFSINLQEVIGIILEAIAAMLKIATNFLFQRDEVNVSIIVVRRSGSEKKLILCCCRRVVLRDGFAHSRLTLIHAILVEIAGHVRHREWE